jgi:two-component system, OmpR family, sensor kinase
VKSKSYRFILASALITTALSLLIGGFATVSGKNEKVARVDQQLATIADFIRLNPNSPVSAALDIASEQDFNITIALSSLSGELSIINESQLPLTQLPDPPTIARSLISPVTVVATENYRLTSLDISGGDRLLLAQSVKSIEESFTSNLSRLFGFTAAADIAAITLSYLVLRRNTRRLEADSLARMQRFLADASHELRTPLTVIKGYSEMLGKGQIKDSADQLRAFERVNSEIVRMENLIHDLLLLAELGETADPVEEEVDLSELVHAYAHDFQVLNSGRSIQLAIDPEISITGSRDHLGRLLQNILNNISRHTPSDAPVRISLRKTGKKIRLVIEDGGAGLPESSYRDGIELLNRFDAARSRSNGGSGLGLSIIAAIVHEHEGILSLRKSDLGGLAVEITV